MLATTDGDLIALTSAFGKRGWFYDQWRNGGDGYTRTRKVATEILRISPAFLENERSDLGH